MKLLTEALNIAKITRDSLILFGRFLTAFLSITFSRKLEIYEISVCLRYIIKMFINKYFFDVYLIIYLYVKWLKLI